MAFSEFLLKIPERFLESQGELVGLLAVILYGIDINRLMVRGWIAIGLHNLGS